MKLKRQPYKFGWLFGRRARGNEFILKGWSYWLLQTCFRQLWSHLCYGYAFDLHSSRTVHGQILVCHAQLRTQWVRPSCLLTTSGGSALRCHVYYAWKPLMPFVGKVLIALVGSHLDLLGSAGVPSLVCCA